MSDKSRSRLTESSEFGWPAAPTGCALHTYFNRVDELAPLMKATLGRPSFRSVSKCIARRFSVHFNAPKKRTPGFSLAAFTPDSIPLRIRRSPIDRLGNHSRRKSSLRNIASCITKTYVYGSTLSLPRYRDISDLSLTRAHSPGQEIDKERRTRIGDSLRAARTELSPVDDRSNSPYSCIVESIVEFKDPKIRHAEFRGCHVCDSRHPDILSIYLINRILRWEQFSLAFISNTTFILFLRRQVHRRGERPELGEMN